MIGIENIDLALTLAKSIATDEGKAVQEWGYEGTSGQLTVYSSINTEEKYISRITPGESSVLFSRVLPHHEDAIEAVMIRYDTKDIIELLVTFFAMPEETYEALLDMETVFEISCSR